MLGGPFADWVDGSAPNKAQVIDKYKIGRQAMGPSFIRG